MEYKNIKLNNFLDIIKENDEVTDALKNQGKCKNKPDNKYDAIELEIGTEVEYEHVDSKEQSKEIAKDHLEENPHYYTQVLAPGESEVMDITKKILKKYGYDSIKDYMTKNEEMYSKKISAITNKPFIRSAIISFFKKQSSAPKDYELHKWAKLQKFNVHEVETEIYKLVFDYVKKSVK